MIINNYLLSLSQIVFRFNFPCSLIYLLIRLLAISPPTDIGKQIKIIVWLINA